MTYLGGGAERSQTNGRFVGRPLEDYIMPEPNSGCWLWTAFISPDGYARCSERHGSPLAYHVTYEREYGPIPAGMELDHKCRVRCCVNPAHLEPVTKRVNVLRGIGPTAVNARKTHCPREHELIGHNLIVNKRGSRTCRECNRLHSMDMRRKARERREARHAV